MTKLLKVTIAAAMLLAMFACVASAGQNAGSHAKMYWNLTSSTMSTARNSVAATAKLQVNVYNAGTMNIRGADIQIICNAFDASGPPQAWQATSPLSSAAGPANGNFVLRPSGFGTTTWPGIWAGITGIATSQDGGMLLNVNSCVTPHGVGVFWYSSAGATAASKATGKEYAAYGFQLDLSGATGPLTGDLTNPIAVCLNPNYRLPCGVGELGAQMVLVDATATKDNVPFDNGFSYLTWSADLGTPGCPGSTPVGSKTWGQIKKLYH